MNNINVISAYSLLRRPVVSIVMPSHNHAQYIGRTIAAIQAQSFTDWELIVMDWASTDTTWDVLDGIVDPRIIKVRYPEPGMGKALNAGFSITRGKYLCWHQTDNVPCSDWLQVMVRELDEHPDVDFVYSDFENIDESGRTLEVVSYGPFDPDSLICYCLVGPTFLYRRAIYETVGDYLESHPRDDHDFWVRIWLHGFHFKNLPVNLGRNRLHDNTRMCRMREEYNASVADIVGPAIHAAQARGLEVMRIRDRSPEVLALFNESYERRCYHGLPFMDAAGFVAWNGDYVLICGFDPDDALARDLDAAGIPSAKIMHIFLPPRESIEELAA